MVVSASPSTVSLDHMYAKNETLLEEDLLSGSTDFLSTWCEVSSLNKQRPLVGFGRHRKP